MTVVPGASVPETIVRAVSGLMAGMQEPCLLVDGGGAVVVANPPADESFGSEAFRGSATIVDILADAEADAPADDPAEADAPSRRRVVERLIEFAWRSGRAVPSSVVAGTPPRRWRCEAWRLDIGDAEEHPPYLVVHLRSPSHSDERFALLESQLEAASREVDGHRVTSERLRATTDRWAAVFGSAPIGMAVAEVDGGGKAVLTHANFALASLTGFDVDQLDGMSLAALLARDDGRSVSASVLDLVHDQRQGRHVRFDASIRHASGDDVEVTVNASRLDDLGTGTAVGRQSESVVVQFVDLTERRRYESQLRYLADHDVLTGLCNRRRFDEELEGAVARVRRYGSEAVVLLIDLDNFKRVNDAHGHAVGDELLRCAARIVESRLREPDLAARHGGDEFAVLLPETDLDSAIFVADQLREDILGASVVDAQGRTVTTSVTIGVAQVTGERSGDEVLVEADIAVFEARGAGRDRIGVADPARVKPNEIQTGHSWLQRIRDALRHDRFVLHAQPIIDLRNGATHRHELLLRIEEDDELIAPGRFLYIAERYGLIHAIDRWVVERAVGVLEDWQSDSGRGLGHHAVSVNLSGATITDEPTIEFIETVVSQSSIDPSQLSFELTETAAIHNIDRAAHLAGRLAALGCPIALDDVGAGFGSFAYLKHLPCEVIKIDGDYVADLPNNPTDQLIVKALVDVADGMGKRVVAEWVDRPETLDLLMSYGVGYAQGFLIGRPIPVDEVVAVPDLDLRSRAGSSLDDARSDDGAAG